MNIQHELETQRKILEEATAKIKEIESQLASEKEPKIWRPKQNESYIFISGDGTLIKTINEKGTVDCNIMSSRNFYHPNEEPTVKKLAKKIRLMKQLQQIAIAIDPERKGEFVHGQKNYVMYYDMDDKSVRYTSYIHSRHIGIYFSTEALAKQAYQMLDDENKRTLQGDYT